jgi:hypothetical protein
LSLLQVYLRKLRTVNPLAYAFTGSNPVLPTTLSTAPIFVLRAFLKKISVCG